MRTVPVLLLLAACQEKGEQTTIPCTVEFTATVNAGADAGLELAGTLYIELDQDSVITGALSQEGQEDIPVSGSAAGHGINLVFTLADGRNIFGTGSSDQAVDECTGSMGGPFTGPAEGDSGDWLARARARDGSTPDTIGG